MENYVNFFPTPKDLIRDILKNVHLWEYDTILEPSAGKGDIIDYMSRKQSGLQIDCIEINPDLQATLIGKEYKLVHDDFLTFEPKYRYDLIVMNPPFDKGAKHLLKALDIEKCGGRIICILNAETIKNPCTIERRILVNRLQELDASIEYRTDEFASAERTTSVEIAVIDVTVPDEYGISIIIENLKQKYYKDEQEQDITDVAENDFISAAVTRYNMEVEAGINLIREYKAIAPYLMDSLDKKNQYSKPILQLKIGDKGELSECKFVKLVRYKYWTSLFSDRRFTGPMTSDMERAYREKVNELKDYDFSVANIKELQIQMCGNLIEGIETAIMKLFDDLSYVHAWSHEYDTNVHYYNGWASNKAWYVNKKVILPVYGVFSQIWKKFRYSFEIESKFTNMEKAFNYLAGCPGADIYISSILSGAEKIQQTKNISCKYFDLTFYKKGTVHITFKDMDLLKKLNIFGGKGKNMLPPRYGKVSYEDMTPEEQAVVNEFDGGREEYMNIYNHRDQYIVQNTMELLQLEETA